MSEDKDASKRLDAAHKAGKQDAFLNNFNKFGSTSDPTRRTNFTGGDLRSTDFTTIETMFQYSWIVKRAVNVLPEDATREWVDLDIVDDNKGQEIIADINKRLKQTKAIKKFRQALSFGRLYGGSILLIGANDGQEIEEPLKEDSIASIDSLTVLDRWQLDIKKVYSDPEQPEFGEPELYTVKPRNVRGEAQTQKVVHASRVIQFNGNEITDRMKITNAGWHDSILIDINDDLRHYGISLQSGAVLFQDFITKVLKIPNLSELIENDDQAVLNTRIQFALSTQSSLGMSLIEENEEFSKIQTPIQGLDKLINIFIEMVSAATGIPRTRLFGQQLGQLAGAEETTRNYYDSVSAYQELELRDKFERLYKLFLLDKSGFNKGIEPEDWSLTFNSLWQNTDEDVAKTHKAQAEADKIYLETGVITPEEVAESRFTKDGFSLETTIDIDNREEFSQIEDEEGHIHELDGKFTGPPIASPTGKHRHEFDGELTSLSDDNPDHKHRTFDNKTTSKPVQRQDVGGKGKQREKKKGGYEKT